MSINKATLTKIVNGNTEYIYPKTTSDLVQYNSNNTVKDILDNLDSTYLQLSGGALSGDIQILKNTSYIRTLISSIGSSIIMGNNDSYYSIGYTNQDGEFYISIDGNPIIQCAGGNAIFNGNAYSATKDGNGNNISTTYLKKTDASNTYLTKTDASNTYLKKTDASNTYLTKTDASNTYLTKTDASNTYVTTTNGIAYGYLDVVSDETDNANLTVRSLDDGYSNIFIGNHDNATYCSITLDPNNIFSLKYNGSSVITATSVNNIKFYGTADRAESDGNGNNIVNTYLTINDASNTYLTKTDASNTYLTKTDASNTYLKKTDITQGSTMGTIKVNNVDIEVYDDSEIYAELDSNYLKKTDASNTYLTKTDASDTYLKLSGDTMTGNLVIGNNNTDTVARVLYVQNKSHIGSLQVNAAGILGIYSHTNSKYLLYCTSAGVVTLNGNAATATKATQDGSGNTITSTYMTQSVGQIKAGQTISFTSIWAGHITGGSKTLQFYIPTSRVLSGRIRCSALSVTVRHAAGFYPYARSGANGATHTALGTSAIPIWSSGRTIRAGEITSITCDNRIDGITVDIEFGYTLSKDTSGAVAPNNSPITVYGTCTLVFS